MMESFNPVVIIHGGAENLREPLSAAEHDAFHASLQGILEHAQALLNKSLSAVAIVEQVVTCLENDPLYNAGVGAVFDSAGAHQLDASIMDGRDRSAGAVAGVRYCKNPIQVANAVRCHCRYVLLAQAGAEDFAREQGVELVANDYFSTEKRRLELALVREKIAAKKQHLGTVGAVVLDQAGNLAAGTSTGGLTHKQYQRIGDSAVIGAGTYADDLVAVSCTGSGEHYIRLCLAHDIAALVRYQQLSLEQACTQLIAEKLPALGGLGGVIACSRSGEIAMPYNTDVMFRGIARTNQIQTYL